MVALIRATGCRLLEGQGNDLRGKIGIDQVVKDVVLAISEIEMEIDRLSAAGDLEQESVPAALNLNIRPIHGGTDG